VKRGTTTVWSDDRRVRVALDECEIGVKKLVRIYTSFPGTLRGELSSPHPRELPCL